jgi:hypothetical protein
METRPYSRRAVVSLALLCAALASTLFPGGRAMAAEICGPTAIQCEWVDGRVRITVATDPRCPCEEIRVVRDNRREIPLVRAPATFEDADPPGGTHVYSAACITKEGASAAVSCTISCPCKIEGLIVRPMDDWKIQVVWLPPDEGCCKYLTINQWCDDVSVYSGNVEDQTERIISGCGDSSSTLTVCVICTSFDGFKSATCASLGKGAFIRGDANADEATDLTDAVAIFGYLFLGEKKVPCEQAGDVNDDGALDISDGIYVLSFLFTGGLAIKPPIENCGIDSSPAHDLPCAGYTLCQ